jgi:hypothetical protein
MLLPRIYRPSSLLAVAVLLCVGGGLAWRRFLEDPRLEVPTASGKVSLGTHLSAGIEQGLDGREEAQDRAAAEPASGPPGIGDVDGVPGEISIHTLRTGNLFWEQQIEALERAPRVGDAEKARQILALLPSLPEEALESATESAVRLLRDAEYPAAKVLLLNPRSHGRVLSVLFADLLERRDGVVLPALIAIAKTPGHPLEQAARDNLELLLGKNFGGNWRQWERAAERSNLESGKGPP